MLDHSIYLQIIYMTCRIGKVLLIESNVGAVNQNGVGVGSVALRNHGLTLDPGFEQLPLVTDHLGLAVPSLAQVSALDVGSGLKAIINLFNELRSVSFTQFDRLQLVVELFQLASRGDGVN